jgi:hypothetical protein
MHINHPLVGVRGLGCGRVGVRTRYPKQKGAAVLYDVVKLINNS